MALMLKRWWVLALGVAVGLGLALLGLRVVTPTYEATATQLIKGVPGSGTGAPYLAAQFAVARAKSYPALLYSATLLDNIRSDLGPQYTDTRLREQLSASNPVRHATRSRHRNRRDAAGSPRPRQLRFTSSRALHHSDRNGVWLHACHR
ncbi:MAG: hypothetical protein QM695_10505 [Micropruina sp.]